MDLRKSFKQLISKLLNKEEFEIDDNSEALIAEEKSGSLGKSITYSLLAVGLVIAFLYALQSILIPILFSLILSVTLFPVCNFLEKWGFNRLMASLTTLVLAIILFLGISYLFVSQTINIGRDASEIVGKIETVLKEGEKYANDKLNLSRTDIISKAKEELNKAAPDIGGFVTRFFGSIGSFLSMGILVPLIIFFFLYYRDFFKEFFVRACYSAPREKVEATLTKMYEALNNYLGGMLMVMGLIAVLNTIGLMILGIEYAWFFGILASLLMLLPYIGIAIGSIIPALFALATKDSYWYAVGVVAWFQFIQTLEGNIITPNIVGNKVSLNPLVSILSLFLFSMLFGFAGLILALPLMAIIKVLFDAVSELKPYGFLLSEPEKKYLWTERQKRLKPAKVAKENLEEKIDRIEE
ncbi:AI-2E family transporter [Moheibacter sediminis]|nr:AI-2E family transporter [Moheibacter sediminis]